MMCIYCKADDAERGDDGIALCPSCEGRFTEAPPLALRVVTGAEVEQAACVVCMRVDGCPFVAAGSHQEVCPHCDNAIWVSPNSPKGPPRICVPCFMDGKRPDQGGRA